jgi:hypothetical protein
VRVLPSTSGNVDAYVPLADWGIRVHAFRAPITVHVEPRTLERQVLVDAASGDRALLKRTEADLKTAIRKGLLRTVRYGLGGAGAVALVAALALLALGARQRRHVFGIPAAIVLLAAAATAGTLWRAQATWTPAALDHPTYYARGAELVQLLDAAQHAGQGGDSYVSKVEGSLRGFAALLSRQNGADAATGRQALLVSDLHGNLSALDGIRAYAAGRPVFFVGDFGNNGSRAEADRIAPKVAKLGSRVIAVAGNHDSTVMMSALARAGVQVLTTQGLLKADGSHGPPEIEVDGLRVAGFTDPLAADARHADDPRRIFSFAELPDPAGAQERAQRALMAWWDALPQPPDVALVHQNWLAQYLAQQLRARGVRRPVTILTGHDHRQHIDVYGPVVVADAGTAGASGLYGVGKDFIGLAELRFRSDRPGLSIVDLIRVEPVSGAAEAQRVPLEGCVPGYGKGSESAVVSGVQQTCAGQIR